MDNRYPMYVTKHAVESLVDKVKLPAPHPFSQDWEYEVADSTRTAEFLHAYDQYNLDLEEKFALMIIIISSLDDAMHLGRMEDNLALLVKQYLIRDIHIHMNTVSYWAMSDEEDLEDCFYITPFMREILNYISKGSSS